MASKMTNKMAHKLHAPVKKKKKKKTRNERDSEINTR